MSKIEEVKKALSELDAYCVLNGFNTKGIIPTEGFAKRFSAIETAINALPDEPQYPTAEQVMEMLKDVRVGDEVEDYAKGWGRVDRIEKNCIYVVKVTFPAFTGVFCYTDEGKQYSKDLRPSIIAVRRKNRTVKKTIERKALISPTGDLCKIFARDESIYKIYPAGFSIITLSCEYEVPADEEGSCSIK